MCDRAYTSAVIAELQRIASSEQLVVLHECRLPRTMAELFDDVSLVIAAQPVTEHRQLVAQLLAALRLAGVDGDVIEAIECALGEVG